MNWAYSSLALVSITYLLWGFRIGLRPLLKAVIALQILGDLIFSPLLQQLPVLRFIQSLTPEDKFVPLYIMMGCIVAMDLGAVLTKRRMPKRFAPPGPIQFNPRAGKNLGRAFIAAALVAKITAMAASGVLSSPSVIHAILTWQPEDLVGLAFLDVTSLLLFPIGVGLAAMSIPRRPHLKAIAAIIAFSVLSPWKADAVKMAVIYGLVVSHFGVRELKAVFWSRRTAVIAVVIVFIFSIKAQYRYLGEASTDEMALLGGFIGTTSYRFMGGTFQTLAYTVNSVEQGAPLMDGDYNVQSLYMFIPRQLWPGKPRFAGERIYDYLDLQPDIDEPYGTSFSLSVFGTFYIDFGKWLALICSFVLGIWLSLGDRLLLHLRQGTGKFGGAKYVTLSTIWLNSVYSLSEGGLPAAIPTLLCGVVALFTLAFSVKILTTHSLLTSYRPRSIVPQSDV